MLLAARLVVYDGTSVDDDDSVKSSCDSKGDGLVAVERVLMVIVTVERLWPR